MTIEIAKQTHEMNLTKGVVNLSLYKTPISVSVPSTGTTPIAVTTGDTVMNFQASAQTEDLVLESYSEAQGISISPGETALEISRDGVTVEVQPPSVEAEFLSRTNVINIALDRCSSSGGSPSSNIITCICTSSDLLGHCVRISGDKVGDYYRVRTVDITDFDQMPVYGVITQKVTPTLARVQWWGLVENVYTGMEPRRIMFVGYDGYPTHTPPARTSPHWLQVIGYALDATTLLIMPERTMTGRDIL